MAVLAALRREKDLINSLDWEGSVYQPTEQWKALCEQAATEQDGDRLLEIINELNQERWQKLCEQAAEEKNHDKLMKLIEEINYLLELKERREADSGVIGTNARSAQDRSILSEMAKLRQPSRMGGTSAIENVCQATADNAPQIPITIEILNL
ncbi:MAG TPA: hypothetical protein VJS37_09715 [Terriglobales bacterium]|nr:hypothetical protein [Terriglobales bacterium]